MEGSARSVDPESVIGARDSVTIRFRGFGEAVIRGPFRRWRLWKFERMQFQEVPRTPAMLKGRCFDASAIVGFLGSTAAATAVG